jgi:hypothetical protein
MYQVTARTGPILPATRRAAWSRVAAPGSRAGYPDRMLGSIARRSLFAAAAGLLVVACAACSSPSFDPATPCSGVDRQEMKGAYPDLEARIPVQIDGQAADSRDSGRFCAKATLGTLWDAGIREAQFGGGIWALDATGGTSLAGLQVSVFRAPGLTAQLMADEYTSGADATRQVTVVSATNEQINGRPGFRIGLLNGDSRQAIVVWPSADGEVIQVVIGADVGESKVQAAVAALR